MPNPSLRHVISISGSIDILSVGDKTLPSDPLELQHD